MGSKMKAALIAVFSIVFVTVLMAYDRNVQGKPTNRVSIEEYSKCMSSTETQLVVFSYKAKYPNLSNKQIAHVICNK